MCRNIKQLYNFEPPATSDEVEAAALQFVRKISGFTKVSQNNQATVDRAVAQIATISQELLNNLKTTALPKNREAEAEKARQRSIQRFGPR